MKSPRGKSHPRRPTAEDMPMRKSVKKFIFFALLPAHLLYAQGPQVAKAIARVPAPYAGGTLLSMRMQHTGLFESLWFLRAGELKRAGAAGEPSFALGRMVGFAPGRDGRALAVLSQPGPAAAKKATLQLSVFGRTGRPLFAKNLPWQPDEPFPVLAVAEGTQTLVLGNPATVGLRFLDFSGAERRSVSLFAPAPYTLERVLQLRIAAGGRTVAVATMREAARPGLARAAANSYLMFLSHTGDELWRRPLPEISIFATALSASGAFVLVASYDTYGTSAAQRTRLFDRTGALRYEAAHLFRRAIFTAGDHALVLHDKSTLRMIDLRNMREQFVWAAPLTDEIILAAQPRAGGRQTAVLLAKNKFSDGGFHLFEPRLVFLNHSGEKLAGRTLEAGEVLAPYLVPAQDGAGLAILQPAQILIFPWIEE